MRIPKGDRGLYGRFSRWLFEFYKKWWVQYVVSPTLLAVPPAVITGFYGNLAFREALTRGVPEISRFLVEYVIAALLFSALYPTVLLAFAKSVVKKVDSRDLNVDSLLMLVAAIDSVVAYKANRFGVHTRNLENLTKETAFSEITQPRMQIDEIIRVICDFFNTARTDKKRKLIRVVLAVIGEDDRIREVPIYYPRDEPVRSTVDALNDPASAISVALRTKKIVVIENIDKELKKTKGKRKFVDTGNQDDNAGSLICYPVRHDATRSIPFVISIHCDEVGYFKEMFSDLYEHSLQRFALRLSLEYSLLIVKEKLCDPNSQQA